MKKVILVFTLFLVGNAQAGDDQQATQAQWNNFRSGFCQGTMAQKVNVINCSKEQIFGWKVGCAFTSLGEETKNYPIQDDELLIPIGDILTHIADDGNSALSDGKCHERVAAEIAQHLNIHLSIENKNKS